MRDLKELRVEIDRIDREMVALFEERMSISKEVAEYKIATGKKILDKERENQKLEAVKALTHDDFNSHGVEELYKQIMGISRKLQYQLMEEKALGRLPFIMVNELEKKNVLSRIRRRVSSMTATTCWKNMTIISWANRLFPFSMLCWVRRMRRFPISGRYIPIPRG